MNTIRPRRGIRAAAAAVGLGLAAALGFASPAVAVGPGNIDPATPVSLTIHKYEQPAAGDLGAADGTELVNPAGTPLAGVEFTVQRVTSVDLMTNAGWATAEGLTAATVLSDPATYTLGTAVTGTTAADGSLVLSDAQLDGVGLYLVQETGYGTNPIAAPAQPFLVSLPLPTANGTWNYDAHVYPKNALKVVTKTVDDSAAYVMGDTVDWTVTTAVPALPEGTTYDQYAIGDLLDERLDFAGATVTLVDGASRTTLVAGTHYVQTVTTTAGPNGTSDAVLIDFLPAGLALLDAVSPAATIETVLSTTVNSIGDGTITNVAYNFVNTPNITTDPTTGAPYVPGDPYYPGTPGNPGTPVLPGDPTYPGTPSNEPATLWGELLVIKHAEGDQTQLLAGATFEVYALDANGARVGAAVATIRTDDLGQARVALRAGSYEIVETVAPAGYELDSTPIPVTIAGGEVADTAVQALVPNTQVPAWQLPVTGGLGQTAFIIGGVGLLLAAMGIGLARGRKARQDA